jgi:hypothetical protein
VSAEWRDLLSPQRRSDSPLDRPNCEDPSEIGLEHDWVDPGCPLFRPAQNQDAFRPPSAMRRSPVSVSCPVLSSKLLFISMRTWRASLSLRVAEPPCVPSRRSSKWRIRLVIYAGIALSGIAYLLLRMSMCCTCSSTECALRLLRSLNA